MQRILECRLFVVVERTRRTFICLVCINGLNNLETARVVASDFVGKSFRRRTRHWNFPCEIWESDYIRLFIADSLFF